MASFTVKIEVDELESLITGAVREKYNIFPTAKLSLDWQGVKPNGATLTMNEGIKRVAANVFEE